MMGMVKRKDPKTQDRKTNVSLAPLTMDQAVDAIFQISPKDVKKRPSKSQKSK